MISSPWNDSSVTSWADATDEEYNSFSEGCLSEEVVTGSNVSIAALTPSTTRSSGNVSLHGSKSAQKSVRRLRNRALTREELQSNSTSSPYSSASSACEDHAVVYSDKSTLSTMISSASSDSFHTATDHSEKLDEEARSTGSSDLISAVELEIGDLPSLGSKEHKNNACKACIFVHSWLGCKDGIMCRFCHLSHPKTRNRPCKAKRTRFWKVFGQRIQGSEEIGDGPITSEDDIGIQEARSEG
mmetsp:Transcript_168727/g.324437  ORF Transcript_168727/g.324437 Transcript_168727/m.324437 type:complete len:243 (+) Transcript_168727:103-831(+)